MKEHIKILDLLRGLAALSVVLFHFNSGHLPSIRHNCFEDFLKYGRYGVQAFFVISGFIIPLSMANSNYTISNYFNNLLRRFIRISPPAYIAILMSIVFYYASILVKGTPISGMDWPGINIISIFGNFTFSVPYLDTSWFNPILWSLSIEFQFYIIIGLLLPVLIMKKNFYTIPLLLIMMIIGFSDIYSFFNYSSSFVLGILLFLKKTKRLPNYLIVIVCFTTIPFTYYQNGLPETIFGLCTFLIILSGLNMDIKIGRFLGKISYSLYITHWVIGSSSEILLKRIINTSKIPYEKEFMLIVYTIIAIAFSYLFYKYVETPFINFSKKIKANFSKKMN